MNRVVSLMFVGLILGLTVSGAMNAGLASAEPAVAQSSGSAYSKFWELLNREASLVVELNKTVNTTIAQELIENSEGGELNTANISALIWNSLLRLKASGVKLHYTAQELREMADNISRNGLPDDVIQELKEQGWSDGEIGDLETYIASHANDTMGDFDMGSFLGNFSTAMVRVGFKYAGYEAWALQRNYWRTTKTPDMSDYDDSNQILNPDLTLDWDSLHGAYEANDYGRMYDAIITLTSDIRKVIESTNHAPNGSVFKDSYYWPGALRAYNLTRQAYVLLQSIKLGNGNEEIKWLLNGKVMGLQDALMVAPKKQQSSGSLPLPPRPIGPIPVRYPLNPPVSIQSDYGMVSVKNVDVVVDSLANGELSYHVQLALSAEGNIVNNVRIVVRDVNGEVTGEVGMISPSDGVVVWSSPEFSAGIGFESLKIAGTVNVVYTSTDGSTPLSSPGDVRLQSTGGLGAESGPRTFEVTEEYSKTVSPSYIAPNIVFRIEPSTPLASPERTVHFKVHIENRDHSPINGYWTVYFSVPDEKGVSHLVGVSGYAQISGGGSYSEVAKNITYPRNGEYSYWGVFKSGDYSTAYSGKIVVSDRYGVDILKVTHSPEYPSNGAGAVFSVLLRNNLNYSTTREVKLFIDGELTSFERVTLPARGTLNTSLLSFGLDPGWHEYEVTCGNSSWKDRILERSPNQQFAVSLEAFPTELEGGGTVWFTIHVKNFENTALSLSGFVEDGNGAVIKRIDGFEGRIPVGGKNISFSYTVYGVGNHTFKVFLDNSDGKPNGVGEEHWAEVKVEVKPTTSAYATLDCPQSVPQNDERASQCEIKVWNLENHTFSTKITKVVFGNNVIWNGTNTVAATIDQVSITVPPHGVNNVSLTFTVNGIATLLFGDSFFNYKLPEYSPYLVKVYFTNLPPASDRVEITEANSVIQDIYNYGTAFISGATIGGAVALFGGEGILVAIPEAAEGGSGGVLGQILVDSGTLNWFKLLIEKGYLHYKHKTGIIPDDGSDGNDVTGG